MVPVGWVHFVAIVGVVTWKLVGFQSLHSIVFEVSLQELIEVESGGEEIGQNHQEEHNHRYHYHQDGQSVEIREELVAADINYSIHWGSDEPTAGAIIETIIGSEEWTKEGLNLAVEEILHIGVVWEVVVFILLEGIGWIVCHRHNAIHYCIYTCPVGQ